MTYKNSAKPAEWSTHRFGLDLERVGFLSLLGEKKTLERIEHMLKTGSR